MSGDESFVLMISLAVAAVSWIRWNWSLPTVSRLHCGWGYRVALLLLPFVCAGLLLAVLLYLAADDVRNDARYLLMYEALGGAWVLIAANLLPGLGYSVRDDVLERRNGAALWAICGALVALTLCYAGGNIGNGPGWWVVVFCAAISTAALFALWLCIESLAKPAEAITINRDPAAGLRLAGFLVAAGLILGGAVAGDWVSALATVRDFALRGWPVIPLVVVAIIFERLAPLATGSGPGVVAALGLLPMLIYLGGAATWLSISGIRL